MQTAMTMLAATAFSVFLLASAFAQTTKTDSQAIQIIRRGAQPSRQGPAENFTGVVRVDPLFGANASGKMSGAIVTFEPGARTAWHTHPLGQLLIVTVGTGRVQRWGDPVDEI